MEKIESLEEFYRRKFNWIPENLKNDLGHFNLFSVKPYLEGKLKAIPYRRRDFYKIMLFKGSSTVASSMHTFSQILDTFNSMRSFNLLEPMFLNWGMRKWKK
jgi:hypothetical protein